MSRLPLILCGLLLAAGLSWLFPLFHVVRIGNSAAEKQRAEFDAAAFAKSFWNDRLVPSLNQAPDAATVLQAFQEDPGQAREKFGRKVGMSRSRFIVVRGSGTIVELDKKGVGVALENGTSDADVKLLTGLLFGNTVRDATALLDPSSFANSQHFNEISTELNRIVEDRVIPKLKEKAATGQHVRFTGCAEIPDEERDIKPLPLVPLYVGID